MGKTQKKHNARSFVPANIKTPQEILDKDKGDRIVEAVKAKLALQGIKIPEPIVSPLTGKLTTARDYSFKVGGKEHRLTIPQKMFCDFYIASGGDRVAATIYAGYRVQGKDKTQNVYTGRALDLLKRPAVIAYLNKTLDTEGFNDTNVKKQHAWLLNQYEDIRMKGRAVDMYYKLKGEYAPEKFEARVENVEVIDYATKKLMDKKREAQEAEIDESED